MRKARLAELILSLVTSRERASSTAGDLMEEVPARGIFWFWSSVCRTVLSLLWSDFAAEPMYLAGLAFRGFLVSTALLMALMICIVICSAVFGVIVGAMGLTRDVSALTPFRWAFELAGALVTLATQFQVGRWIARRARGREMAACVAFLIVDMAVTTVVGEALLTRFVQTPDVQTSVAPLIIRDLVDYIALFAGAVWVRRRLMKATPQ
jgi:hypothetical protein